ncbi:hypothetical protein C2S53_019107 [Perilla frutescens var. hirtella]|uniref:TF-B3 domain-containing protein n=1 Tax=Perilla frutescens var. hirtella TaxID=608512 RepID=A0AAD4P6H0_PERFH|nr:hypothetical protein C2S53_019107 [Perilla frutescens var. hirtella]
MSLSVWEYCLLQRVSGYFSEKYEATLARESITLQTEDATKRWVIYLARRRGHVFFQEGWSSFIDDNGLSEGDLVTVRVSADLNLWKVSIYDSCGWRKNPTQVANIGAGWATHSAGAGSSSAAQKAPAGIRSSSGVNVSLRFVRELPKYALTTNLELPNTFALAMDRSGGGIVILENAAGSQWEASIRERDNNNSVRYYLAAGGWTEFCRKNHVRAGSILVFTLVCTSEPLIRVEFVDSVQGKELIGQAPRGGLIVRKDM